MTREDRLRWDARYKNPGRWQSDHVSFPWLVEHVPPGDGVALDLACGLGHNAVWLAGQGYRVVGVDISLVGLRRAQESARHQGLDGSILFVQADLDAFRPAPASCDLICVIRYLNRELFPTLVAALRPGGRLIYATLNRGLNGENGDVSPHYLLDPGELQRAFACLQIMAYQEDADMSYLAAVNPW